MSSSRIKVLDEHTINQIAAGEVIENPASVVKELVENALDANASHIVIEVQQGGHSLIRISDNGHGMSPDDALLCLERHATSKIREAEDIQHILSMGFRGEAIPSIASISKFSLLTTPQKAEEKNERATFILVEGGRVLACKEAVRSPGTTIEVKSLFYNTPARRKFQKSPSFDEMEITRVIERLALAHPSIQFELIADQKTILKTPLHATQDSMLDSLKKRIESVLGKEASEALIPVENHKGALSIIGYIGSPSSHKPNRRGQYLFINERPVVSFLVAQAIKEGYGTMLADKRYPTFVLHLKIPGTLLDVNVHPQKKEVRLRQEQHIKTWLIEAVQKALHVSFSPRSPFPAKEEGGKEGEKGTSFFRQETLVLEEKETESPPAYWGAPRPFFQESASQSWSFGASFPRKPKEEASSTGENWAFKQVCTPLHLSLATPAKTPATEQLSLSKQVAKKPSVLATLLGFCILEPFDLPAQTLLSFAAKKEGGLYLLDQRAAYFRVRYEQFLKKSKNSSAQMLLSPLPIELSKEDFRLMQSLLPLFHEMGFQAREFGSQSVLFDAIPSFVIEKELEKTICFILNEIKEGGNKRTLEQKKEQQIALVLSKALIPAMSRLSLEEAKALIDELFACETQAFCPHGKPIFLYFSPDEVVRWFAKIV